MADPRVDALNERLRRTFEAQRARSLRRFVETDESLEEARQAAYERVRAGVRGRGALTRLEEQRLRQRAVEELEAQVQRTIARLGEDVQYAGDRGALAALESRRTALATLGTGSTRGRLTDDAGAVERSFTEPRLRRLNSTLWRHQRETRRAMERSLGTSLRAGRSVTEAAQELLVASNPAVRVPRYMRQLIEATRSGSARELRRTVRRHVGTVRRLGEGASRERGPFTLRQHVEQFVRDAGRAVEGDVDNALRHYMVAKARYQARLVARTEMSAALNAAYVERTRGEPFVKAYRWNTSPTHPRPDVCDMYASTDFSGLGRGVYSPDDLPQLPAHPHCQCYVTSVLDRSFATRRLEAARNARRNGTTVQHEERLLRGAEPAPGEREPFAAWLGAQSRARQDSILGPGRARHLRRRLREAGPGGAGAIVDPRTGELAPLWAIEGRRRPARDLGAAVPVEVREYHGLPPIARERSRG